MAEALAEVTLNAPALPLVANVTASRVSDPETIRGLLVRQVTGMVRWRESVLYMKDQGVESLVELGAGKVLAGLGRRIDRDLATASAGTPEEIEAVLTTL
jgi:[acyl-carrier-protein] S-malonyltransferase